MCLLYTDKQGGGLIACSLTRRQGCYTQLNKETGGLYSSEQGGRFSKSW